MNYINANSIRPLSMPSQMKSIFLSIVTCNARKCTAKLVTSSQL